MDKKDTIIDIMSYLEVKTDDKVTSKEHSKDGFSTTRDTRLDNASLHSNPILKRLFAFNTRKQRDKFSLKDIFR